MIEDHIADFLRLLYSPNRYEDLAKIGAYYQLCRENVFSLDRVRELLSASKDFPLDPVQCPTTAENTSDFLEKWEGPQQEAIARLECIQALLTYVSLPSPREGTMAKVWDYYTRKEKELNSFG